MDPVAVGVVFLLAILGGGFVAVIAQRLATRSARGLARESFAEARRLADVTSEIGAPCWLAIRSS